MKGLISNKLISVPGGTFMMGNNKEDSGFNDEVPRHQVQLSSFRITDGPITVEEYCAFLNNCQPDNKTLDKWIDIGKQIDTDGKKRYFPICNGELPVVYISYYGAKAFADWAGMELPSEAQMEYITGWGKTKKRASTKYPFGNEYNASDYPNELVPASETKENGLGIHGFGLVWTWCQDVYDPNYYSKCDEAGTVKDPISGKPLVIADNLCQHADNQIHPGQSITIGNVEVSIVDGELRVRNTTQP